jgi:opacity protein-like surface antigen
LTVDAQIAVGGMPTGNTSYSFDIIVGVQWRPVENVGVQLGYRALFFGLGSGDGESEFNFDGSLQGLYGGLVVRF